MSGLSLFCDGWEFSKQPFGTKYNPQDDNFQWRAVDLPHDWLIYDTKNLYETSTGWYRKRFSYSKDENTVTSIRFEGVYMDTVVFCNGKTVGEWKYGYSTFELDLTELLCDGENEIAVMVNHKSPNTRWYSGAGIFRKVYLRETATSRIVPDGVYISTKKQENGFELIVSTETARPLGTSLASFKIRTTVIDKSGNTVKSLTSPAVASDLSCIDPLVRQENTSYSVTTQIMQIENPELWDIEQGNLYTLKTELLENGKAVDIQENKFGFRTIEFTTDKGFFINGRWVKIHGCCEHHDLGALGSAVNRQAIRRKLLKLREMGINAVRTSHNMPAREFMELADEMGFLIVSEAFDMWEKAKTDCDYARFFDAWVEKDVASWVRRDRNHPSIIAWSIGNEIYDTHADDRGQEVTSKLVRLVRLHDSRSNGYVTIGSNYMQGENAQKCTDIVKLAGYNYGERLYNEHHAQHPDWMIYGSETASVIQSRGIYHFPLAKTVLADDDEQCSSLGNCATAWGARNTEACIIPDRDAEFCAGQFIWTGFDYIGEPTPYSTKNSYFGQIDTAGFPKDSYYVFRSEWTDYKTSPIIHIFPYWDFNVGQQIDVRVTTNAPKLELFFNGESLGVTEIDHKHGTQLTGDYSLEYSEGVLEAYAYNENGEVIAKDVVRSFGDCASLELKADRTEINADGEDLVFVEITALDENGVVVANANNRVNVKVEGAGRLLGLDNGDSTDYDQYKTTSRRLFSGKLCAIVASKTEAGEIKITAESASVKSAVSTVRAVECEVKNGVSALEECTQQLNDGGVLNDEIPCRQVKLSAQVRELTPECAEIVAEVTVLPINSTYKGEIEYRITNDLGIISKLAEITEISDGRVKLKAQGDGEFYLRALCKNGTSKYHIISVLPFKASGFGNIMVDPYSFVLAGLHTIDGGNIVSGIEQGASFSEEFSWFGFEEVDFGMAGSDEVTVPIYANMTSPTKIAFYDGIPNENGECLGEFVYHKNPKWLTYIPETFKLNRPLKGVCTLVIAGMQSVSVKGFEFKRFAKEQAQISASDYLNIYGDKYTVGDGEVIGIGNNVVIGFGEFDFTAPKRLVVTGKSALAKNSINLCLADAVSGETERVLVEFEGCSEYTERSFELPEIVGKYELSFTFLPGTDFDFKSFRFEI